MIQHSSSLLLGSLLLMMVLSPVFETSVAGRHIMDLSFCLIIVASVLALNLGKAVRVSTVGIAIVVLAIRSTDLIEVGTAFFLVGYVLYLCLIAFAFISLMKSILNAKVIDLDVILDAVSAYLLIGVVWAMIFLIIHTLVPSAFEFGLNSGYELWTRYLYLSFMTLTTLGYGDVTSTNSIVQIWSVLEAVVGVLFQATLIARLVSLYGSRA